MKFLEMLERNPKNYKKAWEQYKDGILLFFSFLSLGTDLLADLFQTPNLSFFESKVS